MRLFTKYLMLFCFVSTQLYLPVLRAQQSSFDLKPPSITHWLVQQVALEGESQEISAVVKDEGGVSQVLLHYRVVGEPRFKSMPMLKDGETGIYAAQVPSGDSRAPGLEYYIEARDSNENISYKAGPSAPLKLTLMSRPAGMPAPEVAVGEDEAIQADDIAVPAPVPTQAEFASSTAVPKVVETDPEEINSAESAVAVTEPLVTTLSDEQRAEIVSAPPAEVEGDSITTAPVDIPPSEKKSGKTWLWVGLGLLVAGGLAAGLSGTDTTKPPPPGTTTLTIQAEPPQ